MPQFLLKVRLRLYIAIAAAAAIICAACNSDIAFSDSKNIPEDWSINNPVVFELDPAAYEAPQTNRFAKFTAEAMGDTATHLHGDFRASIALRYTQSCNARQIKIIAERSALDRPTRSDTLLLNLFDEAGIPLGSGRLGIYETSVAIPYIFSISSGTNLSLYPINYDTTLFGLSDATLTLKPLK